jgi:hypothetical protein
MLICYLQYSDDLFPKLQSESTADNYLSSRLFASFFLIQLNSFITASKSETRLVLSQRSTIPGLDLDHRVGGRHIILYHSSMLLIPYN